jgi:lipopolysaccharide export system permease protein
MFQMLSRYVTLLFIQSWILFSSGLLLLTTVIDFAVKIQQFFDQRVANPLEFVVLYYFEKLPFFLPYLLPTSLLLAAAFTLIRLSRANEIVPILMGGRSLRRVCAPFLVMAVLVGAGLAAIEELVIPPAAVSMTLLEERVYHSDGVLTLHARSAQGDQLYATKFDWSSLSGQNFDFMLVDAKGQIMREIKARFGRWLPEQKCWVLSDGEVVEFEGGHMKLIEQPDTRKVLDRKTFGAEGYRVPIRIEPEKFTAFDYYASYRTLEETRKLIEQFPHIAAYRKQYLQRFITPVTPIVLLLLGLPLIGVLRVRGSALVGGALCAFVLACYYGAMLFGSFLGDRGVLPVEAAALGPTAVFLLIGGFTFSRLRT